MAAAELCGSALGLFEDKVTCYRMAGMLSSFRNLARYISCLMLLTMGLASVAAGFELGEKVLCVNGAGHATVEYSVSSKCSAFIGKEASSSARTVSQQSTHCGSCLDVILPTANATSSRDCYDRAWLTELPASPSLVVPATIRSVTIALLVLDHPPLIPQHPLDSRIRERRTVVLQV